LDGVGTIREDEDIFEVVPEGHFKEFFKTNSLIFSIFQFYRYKNYEVFTPSIMENKENMSSIFFREKCN